MAKIRKRIKKPSQNELNVPRWVCLDIRHRYSKPEYYNIVSKCVSSIMGKDFIDVFFVGHQMTDTIVDNNLSTYLLVKCCNIHNHLSKLDNSKYISKVLNFSGEVIFLEEEEIDKLRESWIENVKDEHIFCYGDVASIKHGTYSNLNGIVIGANGDNLTVLFKFRCGYQVAVLRKFNCVNTNENIFDYIRVPNGE